MSERTAKITLTALLLLLMIAAFNPIPTINRVSADSTFRIKQRNPVVNEEKKLKLTATDLTGNPISGVVWESGSPDIAEIDSQSGVVTGNSRGFATITARRGSETSSVFIVVARVRKGTGAKVPGDTKVDTSGNIYISNPNQNVILKADNELTAPTQVYAGTSNQAGQRNGNRLESLFAGPTAIGVDNRPQGGLFVTDTLNHSIRKISFNGQVETSIGNGAPGTTNFNANRVAGFDQTFLRSPRGVAADAGGNLFLADTDNHAVYYIDFTNRKTVLIAGEPGQLGKSDGNGRAARFQRPSGLALSSDGRLLSVADQDNNRVRLIELKRDSNNELLGEVTTIGTAPGSANLIANNHSTGTAEVEFNKPQSVSFDGAGNLYVVDDDGVQVVTQPLSQNAQVVALAQPGESFQQASSVVVKGTESFVLDTEAANANEAIAVVSVGAPEIKSVTPDVINMFGDAEITVMGKNFAPESVVTFGDNLISDVQVVSATEIRFRAGIQKLPGVRLISILTRGGLTQQTVNVVAKPASMLAKGEITTIAGGVVFTGDGGLATEAGIGNLSDVIVDSAGNLYLSNQTSNNVRQIDAATGMIITITGGGGSLAEDIPANIARIAPRALAIDREGNLFIADLITNSVRRVDARTRIITTVAGGQPGDADGDGGPARLAQLGFSLSDIAFDNKGNLYIGAADRIRRVDAATGIITTIAGGGTDPNDNVPATQANLSGLGSLAFDRNDNLFVTAGSRIRKIDTNGTITTFAGNGKVGNATKPGSLDGQLALSVALITPRGLNFDSDNNLVLVNNLQILRINQTTNRISEVKFTDNGNNFSLSGDSLTIDGDGNIYTTAFGQLLKIDAATKLATVFAGSKRFNFRGDGGPAVNASIGRPENITADQFGNIYLSDLGNAAIRQIDMNSGLISTVAGLNAIPTKKAENGNANDVYVRPISLLTTANGDVIFSDFTRRVRRVSVNKNRVTTIAGNGRKTASGDDGPALAAGLGFIASLALDQNSNLLISAQGLLRRVDKETGIITTAGDLKKIGFGQPHSTVVDAQGNIYVTTSTNFVFKLSPDGSFTPFINTRDLAPYNDEQTGLVQSLALRNNQLYLASYRLQVGVDAPRYQTTIHRVDLATGAATLIIGSNGEYSGDGGAFADASLIGIPTIALDKDGNLLVMTNDGLSISALRFLKLTD